MSSGTNQERLEQNNTLLSTIKTDVDSLPNQLDTSDATATESDIKIGKTAYVNGDKITGIHIEPTPTLQGKTIIITENGTQTVTADTGKDGLSSVEITTNVSGIVPTGTLEITENGTYDVTQKASVNVNVSTEPVMQEETIVQNYSPNGQPFVYTVSDLDFYYDSIEVSIDTTNQSSSCNIFSFGEDIAYWEGKINLHLYTVGSTLQVCLINDTYNEDLLIQTTFSNNSLILKLDKNGLTFNGTLVTENDFGDARKYRSFMNNLLALKTMQVGSAEGSNRSYSTYNYIKVTRKV